MNMKITSRIVGHRIARVGGDDCRLFNKGVGADGTTPLAVGTADPHYILNGGTSSPTPGSASTVSAC
ncbi:hypothetical protein [uncultured Sphingomonas sp.]|uniref:hypothetical protein n=1 Tax=uncultured Sphingomonas sp. TaxID=158754 RepID=UPI0035CAA6A8